MHEQTTQLRLSDAPAFADAMKFGGPAPEIINGRLAMVGFIATAINELQHRGTIEQQLLDSPVPVGIFVLATVYATLVPIMKGVKNEAFGECPHPRPQLCTLFMWTHWWRWAYSQLSPNNSVAFFGGRHRKDTLRPLCGAPASDPTSAACPRPHVP